MKIGRFISPVLCQAAGSIRVSKYKADMECERRYAGAKRGRTSKIRGNYGGNTDKVKSKQINISTRYLSN